MHLDRNGLEILTPVACRDLVEKSEVGRLGFADDDSVTLLPVSYAVVADHVVVRTTRGSKLAAAASRRTAALEIDDIDVRRHTGWSVLVRGRLEVVADDAEVADLDRAGLRTWPAEGNLYLRMSIDELSGRRMHPRARLSTEAGAPGSGQ